MIQDKDDIPSLRQRLINWLFTPLYLWLLFSTVTGYLAAVHLSNKPYDLVLLERAKLLASRYDPAQNNGGLDLDRLFPEAEGELRFALYDMAGRRLAGVGRLPAPRPAEFRVSGPGLRDTRIADHKLRLLTLRTPGQRGGAILVQAAEPIEARLDLGRSILGNIVIPQFIFILIAGIAVWIGLKKGLEPLERLRRQVANRPRDDLRPLEESLAPNEVRPLIREVNALIERLKGLMESQRRFVADAAHQLRTPFAGLSAQAELARREEVSLPVKEALDRICAGTQRCSRLVSQLLTLARNEPEARLQTLQERLDLGRIAQEAASHWAPEALRHDIDLGYEGTSSNLTVMGEEGGLRDLIDNLIDNAIRYTPAGGHVTVRVGYERGVWIKVEDDGPGIPPEQHSRVFERFHRIPGSGQPGSGLGLAIVQEVVNRHGAGIDLTTGPGGRGTTFTVRFLR